MKIALVLAGGVSLGAYQGGAFEAMHGGGLSPDWIAGSSVGAINGAIIAGNPPDRRLAKLRQFWDRVAQPAFAGSELFSAFVPEKGPVRGWHHLASAVQTRLFGQPNFFLPTPQAGGIYDLSPLRQLVAEHVDFSVLNRGPIRFSLLTSDIETGDPVVFDTARERIEAEHLIASCGLIGDFPALEIEGRLLGDGGLIANAPVELVLQEAGTERLACFVIDLFSRHGPRPASALDAGERRSELIFASQTWQTIRHYQHLLQVRSSLSEIASHVADPEAARRLHDLGTSAASALFVLSYCPDPEEAVMRGFDFSIITLSRRWRRGAAEMHQALEHFVAHRWPEAQAGLTVFEVE